MGNRWGDRDGGVSQRIREGPAVGIDGHAGDARLVDQIITDPALQVADHAAGVKFEDLAEDDEIVAGVDNATELGAIDGGEPDELVMNDVVNLKDDGGELSAGLDHHDGGHERLAGDVAGRPPLIIAHVLDGDSAIVVFAEPGQFVELEGQTALGNVLHDADAVERGGIEVDCGKIEETGRSHNAGSGTK